MAQRSLHAGLEVDASPAVLALYADRSCHPAVFAERALAEEPYGDYRRQAAALLFPEAGLHGKAADGKARPDLLCPSLILNGAYKCVKCGKVRLVLKRIQSKS